MIDSINKLIKGWGKIKESSDKKKQAETFPGNFKLSSDDIEFISKNPEELPLIKNWAVSQAKALAREHPDLKAQAQTKYPSAQWEDGLFSFFFGPTVIKDTEEEQVKKLLKLKELGYKIPDSLSTLIVNTLGKQYTQKYYIDRSEGNSSILYINLFFISGKDIPTFQLTYYPEDSLVNKKKDSISLDGLYKKINSGELEIMNDSQIKAWTEKAQTMDNTRDKFKNICYLFPEGSKQYSFEGKDTTIKSSEGDVLYLQSWQYNQNSSGKEICIIYQKEEDYITDVIRINYSNCAKYPNIVNYIDKSIASTKVLNNISFFVRIFGDNYFDGKVLFFKEGFHREKNGALYDKVYAKTDLSLFLFSDHNGHKEKPIDDSIVLELFTSVLLCCNQKVEDIVTNFKEDINNEKQAQIHTLVNHLEANLSSYKKNPNDSLTMIWDNIKTIYGISKKEEEGISFRDLSGDNEEISDKGGKNTEKYKDTDAIQEPSDSEKSSTIDMRISHSSPDVHKENLNTNSEVSLIPEDIKLEDNVEEKLVSYSGRKDEDTGSYLFTYDQEDNNESFYTSEEEQTEEANYDKIFIDVVEVPRNSIKDVQYYKKEMFKNFASLICKRLELMRDKSNISWINKSIGIPHDAEGNPYTGLQAILLSMYMEDKGFVCKRFLNVQYIKNTGLKVRQDATGIFVVIDNEMEHLYNLEETNFEKISNSTFQRFYSQDVEEQKKVKPDYSPLDKNAKSGVRISEDGKQGFPRYELLTNTAIVGKRDTYDENDRFYTELSIALAEGIRKLDLNTISIDQVIQEDLISHLSSAFIGRRCSFDTPNEDYSHIWITWLSKNVSFVESTLHTALDTTSQIV